MHLFDFVNLEQQHPDAYENLFKGYFSFNKICSDFSSMALEQHHEDTPAFRQIFVGDVNKFLENFIVGHYRQFYRYQQY